MNGTCSGYSMLKVDTYQYDTVSLNQSINEPSAELKVNRGGQQSVFPKELKGTEFCFNWDCGVLD